MNTEPVPFVPEAPVPSDATLKVLFRAEERGDRNLILSSWGSSWRWSLDCRNLSENKYRHTFQDLVVGGYGVLQAQDTQVLVGCSPRDRAWIWCFCVFTPAEGRRAPVVHWMNVRPTLRADDGKRSIRRIGLATRMLAVGGGLGPDVRDALTYTCRPGPMTAHRVTAEITDAKRKIADAAGSVERMEAEATLDRLEDERDFREEQELEALESDLLVAARNIGITASYLPLARWIQGGQR